MSKLMKRKIGDLVDVFNHLRVPLSSKQRESLEKKYPYYGAQGVVDQVDKYIFDGEYILVAEDGENLRSNNQNICNLVRGKFWVNNHAHILKANKKNNTRYLYYNFNRIKFEPYVTGSAQPKLNKENLLNITSFVHEKEDQDEIATVLSSLDSKIELNNKINAELESLAKTIYDYWFVQFDFPISKEQAKAMGNLKLEGKPYRSNGGKMAWSEDLKREMPEGWEVIQLIDACYRIGDGIHGTPEYIAHSDYNFINGNNLRNGFIYLDNETKKVSKSEYEKYFVELNEDTILISINGTLGNLAIYLDEKIMLGKSSAFINCKKGLRDYCYQYLSQNEIQNSLWHIATGSTIKNLSLKSLKSLKLVYPTSDILSKFNEIVAPLTSKRINVFHQNEQLVSLRDWLLPMLMNGQVTVGDAVSSSSRATEEKKEKRDVTRTWKGKYEEEKETLNIAAEQSNSYGKIVKLNIPKDKKSFAKQVLAGKIVSLFKDDKHFTDVKFQKLQYLAEHVAEVDLDWNYYRKPAGPFDHIFMYSISEKFAKSKWYSGTKFKFKPLEKVKEIDNHYKSFFEPANQKLEKLFKALKSATEQQSEIYATIYAVWNDLIIKKQKVTNEKIIELFYAWSERKKQYDKKTVLAGINWLRKNEFEPRGFGYLIKELKK